MKRLLLLTAKSLFLMCFTYFVYTISGVFEPLAFRLFVQIVLLTLAMIVYLKFGGKVLILTAGACLALLPLSPMTSIRRQAPLGIKVVPVIYGEVNPTEIYKQYNGDVILGGCMVPFMPARRMILISIP